MGRGHFTWLRLPGAGRPPPLQQNAGSLRCKTSGKEEWRELICYAEGDVLLKCILDDQSQLGKLGGKW